MGATQTSAQAGERLDSWKEISAYLKRDPRTLQRWEKKEGLPVHRHVHDSQVSIYAYTSELDAWLASRTLSNNGNGTSAAAQPAWDFRLVWAGIAISTILLSIAGFAIFRGLSPSAPVTRAFRQVWTGDGVDYWDAVSPDGRYVSYTDIETGDLAIHDLTSGQNRRLTHKGKSSQESPAWAFNSAFSPDGKSIAYWWRTDDRVNEVRVIGLDGSGQKNLLRDPERTSYVLMDWSPDGKFISAVIDRGSQQTDLALISAHDGSIRVLKHFAAGATPQRAAFSRDSRYLAYDATADSDGNGDVFLASVDGKTDQRVIGYPTNEYLVGWTPRGDGIVFGSDRTGVAGIWSVSVAQGKPRGEPQLLKSDIGSVLPLAVTRTGSIFMLLQVGLEDVFLTEIGSGSAPVRLSEHFVGARTNPSFSPDGQTLLYQGQRGAAGAALYVRSLGSGSERAIHPRLADFQFPRWTANGRAIEVSGSDGATTGIWRIDPQNGAATRIESGQRKRVYKPSEGMLGPGGDELAPDRSAYLVAVRNYPKSYNSLLVVPANGGQTRTLVQLAQPEHFFAGYTWSPDSRYVYFPRANKSGTDLLRVPVAGGPIENTGLHMPVIRYVSIHPDGKRVAFQSGDTDEELWALDGFLAH